MFDFMPKATCTNAYILLNTAAGVLYALPALLSPIAALLPGSFSIYVAVSAAVLNTTIALYQKNVEAAAQAAIAAAPGA